MPPQTIHSTTAGLYRAAAILQAHSNPVIQMETENLLVVKIGAECYYIREAVSGFILLYRLLGQKYAITFRY